MRMGPRFDMVVVTSRAARRFASPRMKSFANSGARRRSGFFSSAIMRFMRLLSSSACVAVFS